MKVNDAERILSSSVNGALNREAGGIDVVSGVHDLLAVEIDFDKTRGGHFIEQHAIWIQQEMVFGAGHTGRKVSEDEIVPSVESDKAICGSKIDTSLPFFGGNKVTNVGFCLNSGAHSGSFGKLGFFRRENVPPIVA